ncbi:unnamed protein product [Rotaria sordida]|uniref:MORN repeat-containing protein 4 n=1 Tax=Rotaria sordida TaxID=392033 RepID=A0A818IE60_9BILA|nr:unnamed protein product [Rotaria sordida]CAF1115096.1 unnamed protein product [Rotaria sordida]CAF1271193.1 unnamed protein product [Rotaria sordida]CAF1346404.1 unnamed protein product [Rotaria sordida]CAF1346507.1 unnamed protein product [Rotaria sordida]
MQGTFRYPDGSEYTGEWNEDGQRHGLGQLTFSDQAKYRGRFENGLFSGLGSISYPDGSKYDGEFSQGRYHGLGVFTRCDGMKYEGQLHEGKIFGLGLLTFADGSHGLPRNEGHFENNKLVRREKCPDTIRKAIACAERAKSQHI